MNKSVTNRRWLFRAGESQRKKELLVIACSWTLTRFPYGALLSLPTLSPGDTPLAKSPFLQVPTVRIHQRNLPKARVS